VSVIKFRTYWPNAHIDTCWPRDGVKRSGKDLKLAGSTIAVIVMLVLFSGTFLASNL
jgi:hypothetical protein